MNINSRGNTEFLKTFIEALPYPYKNIINSIIPVFTHYDQFLLRNNQTRSKILEELSNYFKKQLKIDLYENIFNSIIPIFK